MPAGPSLLRVPGPSCCAAIVFMMADILEDRCELAFPLLPQSLPYTSHPGHIFMRQLSPYNLDAFLHGVGERQELLFEGIALQRHVPTRSGLGFNLHSTSNLNHRHVPPLSLHPLATSLSLQHSPRLLPPPSDGHHHLQRFRRSASPLSFA